MNNRWLWLFPVCVIFPSALVGEEIPPGLDGFKAEVAPFFEKHCVSCHGPEKSKGKITVHSLDGDLSRGKELEKWEVIMEMIESGEMPPEEEEQPAEKERLAVARWIEQGMKDYVSRAKEVEPEPLARRLTNFEYENTLRDLLGIDLKVIDDLPKDPEKPYAPNNTAELMRLGPEQIDRYLEVARRAMASTIVDPEMPEVHKSRKEWPGHGIERGLAMDELGVWGNRRHSPSTGMGLKKFPRTGEFRIRFQASAILPSGIEGLPLGLIMGYGINVNSSTQLVESLGEVRLTNSPDDPKVYEFRGRMENIPIQIGRVVKGRKLDDSITITPRNLYNDGTLNDGNRNLAMPRAVINWMEFEAPVFEEWPPAHHCRILFESPLRESDPEKYVSEVLEQFISRAFRRPATAAEVARFLKIYNLLKPELGTMEAALRETLSMVLISPQFLMHTVSDGKVATKDDELASRLSYFLWGSQPDDELSSLAREGKLQDPDVVEAQVLRLLQDQRAADFVRNFTTQWLSLSKMKTVPINQDLFPRFLYYVPRGERAGTEEPYRPTIRDYMMDETVAFIGELIRRNAEVFQVVDSDFAMLNQALAAHYGVEGVQGNELRPVSLKAEHRLGGLLTHGSVLIGNGTGSAPHPIYRAVWLREAILGDEVKPPPADVPALTDSAGDSAEVALSIKDLLALHREKESCNDCHVRLDPWGIPFERYNAIGRYQSMVPKEGARISGFQKEKHQDLKGYREYLKTVNTEVVEAEARVPHGPEVDGMADLKAHLLKSRKEEIAANVVRRLMAYGLGRELGYRDRFAVEEILRQAEKKDYGLRDLIVLVCRSDLFRGVIQKN